MNANQSNGHNETAHDSAAHDSAANEPTADAFAHVASYTGSGGSQWPLNRELLNRFFNIAGGSILYCLSAVLVAYGISRVLTPVLGNTDTLRAALPGIATLWIYELALLVVLLLIVWRKVVDDAVSVVIIIALYLVASSIALGAVADRDPKAAAGLAILALFLAILKLFAMRRFVRIPFSFLAILALAALVGVNYYAPLGMSRLMIGDAAPETVRRAWWFAIQLAMCLGPVLVLIQMTRSAPDSRQSAAPTAAFLQSPAMVCLFALVLLAASGVHAWAISYMYALPEFLGDYLLFVLVGSLLALEILPRLGLRFGFLHVAVASLPLVALAYAIWNRSVNAAGDWALDLLVYPPVFCTFSGLAVAAFAWRRKYRPLRGVVFVYFLGAILTCGFAPECAHALNVRTAGAVLAAVMIAYGVESWRPYYCIVAVALVTFGAALTPGYMQAAANWGLNEVGAITAIGGIGLVALSLLFGKALDRPWRLLGAAFLTVFTYDLLGPALSPSHAAAFIIAAALAAGLYTRTRDGLSAALIALGAGARLCLAFAIWKYVALGFAALIAGTIISLRKRR